MDQKVRKQVRDTGINYFINPLESGKVLRNMSEHLKRSDPFFTIVIVSLNAEELICKTLNSVLMQTFKDYEIIVKDGGSTDRTLEQIQNDDEKIRVVVAPDKGIYDAMNQGISLAKGKYLYFLNCGDILQSNDVLEKIYVTANQKDTRRIIYGDFIRDGIVYEQPEVLKKSYMYRTSINHQTTFWGKEVFERLGDYRSGLKVAADYELEVRAFFDDCIALEHAGCVVCTYLSGGYSDSEAGRLQLNQDLLVIRGENFLKSDILKWELLQKVSLKDLRRWIDSPKSPKMVRTIYRTVMNKLNRYV